MFHLWGYALREEEINSKRGYIQVAPMPGGGVCGAATTPWVRMAMARTVVEKSCLNILVLV
jgi:hypothetical protein